MSITHNRALVETAQKLWPFPNPPLDMGVEDGIVWATCRAPIAGVNAYCLIPAEGHPWSNGTPTFADDDYEGMDRLLEVHGGLTYHGDKWIGFDTCHGGDIWDAEYDSHGITRGFTPTSWDRHWTPEMVAEEAKSLARQIAKFIEPVCIEIEA